MELTAFVREAINHDYDNTDTFMKQLDSLLWDTLSQFQNQLFYTAKRLEFSYKIRGNEMFVNRKDKSITRATVTLAFHTAIALQKNNGMITGPKQLKTFGASYLYPIFIYLGIIMPNPVP